MHVTQKEITQIIWRKRPQTENSLKTRIPFDLSSLNSGGQALSLIVWTFWPSATTSSSPLDSMTAAIKTTHELLNNLVMACRKSRQNVFVKQIILSTHDIQLYSLICANFLLEKTESRSYQTTRWILFTIFVQQECISHHSADLLFIKKMKTRLSRFLYRITPYGTLQRKNCFFLFSLSKFLSGILSCGTWLTKHGRSRNQLTQLA